MIKSAIIRNYKCFEELTVPELSRINLVSGANNVGKSAFLEALFLFLDRYNPQAHIGHYAFRGIPEISADIKVQLRTISNAFNVDRLPKITLHMDENDDETLELSLVQDIPSQYDSPNSERVEGTDVVSTEKKAPSGALRKRYSKKENIEDFYAKEGKIYPAVTKVRQPASFLLTTRGPRSVEDEAVRFGNVELEGRVSELVEVCKEIEPRLQDLAVVPTNRRMMVHGDIGLGQKIPIPLMGDGLGRFLCIILAMANYKGGHILIDECENGFHHTIQAKVWQAIAKASKQYDCQVIATTHSYEFLAAAYEGVKGEHEADFRFIRLDRFKDGRTVAKSFDHELLGYAIESGMEVR